MPPVFMPPELVLDLPSLAATERLAAALADALAPGDLVGLTGDLGAGKTALVRAFVAARGAGPDAVVPSPTFTLANRHQAGDLSVHHLDVYRVADLDELEAAGARDLLFDPDAVCFVEWFDRVAGELDAEHLHVAIARQGERRRATLRAHGERAARVVAALTRALADLIPSDPPDGPPPAAADRGAPRGAAGAPPSPRDGDGA